MLVATTTSCWEQPCYHWLTFSSNQASDGGAIYNDSLSVPNIIKNTFTANRSIGTEDVSGGGAIYNYQGSPEIKNCVFQGNNAVNFGGGIFNFGSNSYISSCTFSNKNNAYKGGAIYNFEGSPSIIDSTLKESEANYGGAIYNNQSSAKIERCTINENISTLKGGGIYNHQSNYTTISYCTIKWNLAVDGAGIYNYSSNSKILYSFVTENSASSSGGGISNEGSNPEIVNCLFDGNDASNFGGGVYNGTSSPVITNCTFSGRNNADYGGAVCNRSSSSPVIKNTIIWDNQSTSGERSIDNSSSTPSVTYSNVQDGLLGTGSINADPKFIGTGEHNYMLQPTSPCVDTGSNVAISGYSKDLLGNSRIINTKVDMGAYEYQLEGIFLNSPGNGSGVFLNTNFIVSGTTTSISSLNIEAFKTGELPIALKTNVNCTSGSFNEVVQLSSADFEMGDNVTIRVFSGAVQSTVNVILSNQTITILQPSANQEIPLDSDFIVSGTVENITSVDIEAYKVGGTSVTLASDVTVSEGNFSKTVQLSSTNFALNDAIIIRVKFGIISDTISITAASQTITVLHPVVNQEIILDLDFTVSGKAITHEKINIEAYKDGGSPVLLASNIESLGGNFNETVRLPSTYFNFGDTVTVRAYTSTALEYMVNVKVFYSGKIWTQKSVDYFARRGHTSVVYNNKMWAIGGISYSVYLNDVQYSTGGTLWTAATSGAAFSARTGHTSVIFKDKIWVIGGTTGSTRLRDVWSSTDGITWIEATSTAFVGSPARYDHTSVVYDGKLWVIGGTTGGGTGLNDVWYSTDGITWTKATSNAAFSARYDHTSIVYDDKMWVIGGTADSTRLRDVWYSTDGITWTQATSNAAFSARYGHTSLVFKNKMWVIGGYSGSYINDLWHSADGITWIQATSNAAFSGRNNHTSLVYDDKMWVLGGYDSGQKDDVWWSE